MKKIYPLAENIITTAAMIFNYKWSDELSSKQINETFDSFNAALSEHIKWEDITAENAVDDYGFGIWSECGEDTLYLIPLILLPIIPEGIELTSINDDNVIFHRDEDGRPNIDIDVRCGLLAYGVKLRKKKTSVTKILWLSRHAMTDDQITDLERIYGDIEIHKVNETVSSYKDVIDIGKDDDVFAVVLPPAILVDLVNPKNNSKPVIRAIANRVPTGETVVNPATGKDETEYRFEHVGWERVLKLYVATEKL